MKVIVFEDETYYKLINEFAQMVNKASKETNLEIEWISAEEVKKLLGFKSKSKMQQLRDNGEIIFTQHGRIIKYSRKSCMEFLERHRVKF